MPVSSASAHSRHTYFSHTLTNRCSRWHLGRSLLVALLCLLFLSALQKTQRDRGATASYGLDPTLSSTCWGCADRQEELGALRPRAPSNAGAPAMGPRRAQHRDSAWGYGRRRSRALLLPSTLATVRLRAFKPLS